MALAQAWLENIKNENDKTSEVVRYHLQDFEEFVEQRYHLSVDSVVTGLKAKRLDVYEVLTG